MKIIFENEKSMRNRLNFMLEENKIKEEITEDEFQDYKDTCLELLKNIRENDENNENESTVEGKFDIEIKEDAYEIHVILSTTNENNEEVVMIKLDYC